MAGDHRLRDPQGVKQANDVADQVQQRVALDLGRSVGLSVAAQVGCDDMKAGCRQCIQLMPPGIPAFGKAVAQQHRVPGPLLRYVHADAVSLDDAMRCL
jgi:hypothetical protein